MVKHSLLFILLAVSLSFDRASSKAGNMGNSDWIWVDSFYVDGTASHFTTAFPLDRGANLSLVVEARDDSTAGFDSDSACVKIELYQAWPFSRGSKEYFVILPSKADPDSTYPGSDWILFDSLDIIDMDTASARFRDAVYDTIPQNRNVVTTWGDSVLVVDSLSYFGAMAYFDFSPDFTPAGLFKVTGLSPNLTDGNGSHWGMFLVQLEGDIVKTK